ncbi:hypothetical protein Pla108_42120 [Botrimarina colliarenosi]|uniref:Uncharacterized protein n=1 Tax=Botrimarina colliarenosi TaxID=2528001 RepID=A0A5C5ZWW9_9BACT|nr:hypothetical protein [Botrimarina colliarenosi]TWT91729.1 hypothetical protein Pla108_42120 [Botrimarina colliarenosi]
MPRRRPGSKILQLNLFRPMPKRPRWDELPLDTRRKTLPLLATLLRSALRSKEASDER